MSQNTKTRKNARSNPWLTVAAREIMVKLTDKAFIISTLSTILFIFIAIGAGVFFGMQETTVKVAVTSEAEQVFAEDTQQMLDFDDAKVKLEVTTVNNADEAKKQVEEKTVDIYLAENPEGGWQLYSNGMPEYKVLDAATKVASSRMMIDLVNKAGVDPGVVAQNASVTTVDVHGDSSGVPIGFILTLAFAVLFFMASMMFGMQISQSVVEEKQSRIVEILVSAIPVRQLLIGKVVGNAVMAVGQMVLFALVGVIGLTFTPWKGMLDAVSSSVAWFLVFFIAGFLALACIWAAAGAMCTRQEDLSYTTTPLTMVLAFAYVVGFMATGTFRLVASYIPIVSSILMPARVAEGDAEWWEVAIALAITIAFAAVTIAVGARIYRRALLQTGGRLTFKQALALQS